MTATDVANWAMRQQNREPGGMLSPKGKRYEQILKAAEELEEMK